MVTRATILSAFSVLLMQGWSCSDLISPCSGEVLQVSPQYASANVGTSQTYQARVGAACGWSTRNATGATWQSRDPLVALVTSTASDGSATVVALHPGRATIVATLGGLKDEGYLFVH